MNNSKIILPKKGVTVFYVIGGFLLFFALLQSGNIINSYPNAGFKSYATALVLFFISIGWFSYRKSGEISNKKLNGIYIF